MDFILGDNRFNTPDSGAKLPNSLDQSLRWSYLSSGNIPWEAAGDISYSFEFEVATNKTYARVSQVRLYATFFDNTNTTLTDVTDIVKFSVSFVQNSNSNVLYFGNDNGRDLELIVNKQSNGLVAFTAICLQGNLNYLAINPAAGSYITIRFAILYN